MSNHEDADATLTNVAPAKPGSTDVTSPNPAKNESSESKEAVLAKETNPTLKGISFLSRFEATRICSLHNLNVG